MSETSEAPGSAHLDSLFDALACDRRRRVLRTLLEASPETVPRGELAAAVVTRADGTPPAEVTDERRTGASVSLRHTDLPKLRAAGLIEYSAEDGSVRLADHPALQDRGVRAVLDGGRSQDPASADTSSLDALFGAIADECRRRILDVLSHQYGPVHVETLARELCAADCDVAESGVPQEGVDAVLVDLRHAHLPALADAGLIQHDHAAGTVAYAGHPALRVPWMHSVLSPYFRASLTDGDGADGIATITGRERVVSFGQSLCDRADEELFAMFTETGLLEAGCLTRLRDASRRGADVYLGVCDEDVREYVEEHAPEVVLWEPETSWLDVPVEADRVGRLLFCDRESVMLGALESDGEDGIADEQALVGEGADDALVVMVRQLLAPRLERLDQEAEDVEAQLPF